MSRRGLLILLAAVLLGLAAFAYSTRNSPSSIVGPACAEDEVGAGASRDCVQTGHRLRFGIGGDLTALLHPGGGGPLNLVLSNPHPFDVRVTALSVRVGAGTTNAHCRGDINYAVAQYSGTYPLVLPPGSTRLSALVSDSSVWPRVSMHDLPTNQDACQDAVLALDYSGLATS
jgi:hypothetical protein